MTKSREFRDEPFDEQKIKNDQAAITDALAVEVPAILADFMQRRRRRGLKDIPYGELVMEIPGQDLQYHISEERVMACDNEGNVLRRVDGQTEASKN